jgi:hypothetical protein
MNPREACIALGEISKRINEQDDPASDSIRDFGLLIDYCCQDVRITVALLKLGLSGQLVDPNNNRPLQLAPLPD